MYFSDFQLYLGYALLGLTIISFFVGFRYVALLISAIPLAYYFYSTEKIANFETYLFSYDFAPQDVDYDASMMREVYARLDSYSSFHDLVLFLLIMVAMTVHISLLINAFGADPIFEIQPITISEIKLAINSIRKTFTFQDNVILSENNIPEGSPSELIDQKPATNSDAPQNSKSEHTSLSQKRKT